MRENPVICEPQHVQALRDHIGVAILVVMPLFIWLMHWAITLNHQLRFMTVEICDVVSKLVLSSELESA